MEKEKSAGKIKEAQDGIQAAEKKVVALKEEIAKTEAKI